MNGSSALGAAMTYHNEHGGGGTGDYNALINQPSINGKTLIGNMTGEELGLTTKILSIERLGNYIYKATFDSIPEYESNVTTYKRSGCTSFLRNGKLYRNLDFFYDNTAEFLVITKDFDGVGFIQSMNDGSLDPKKVEQLPYHINDGCNRDKIKVSSHILFNDFNNYAGSGSKNKDITLLPHYILTNLHAIGDINTVLSDYLGNLFIPSSLSENEYLMQYLVTDGITTYVITPKNDGSGYEIVNITSLPKLANFKWLNKQTLQRTDSGLQLRPNGIERWNLIESGASLKDLRFTLAYESPDRLSEFIGMDDTTKSSSDAELTALFNTAHTKYLSRTRDGELWQTVHSVIYGDKGIESLYTQENYEKDYIIPCDEVKVDNITIAKNINSELEVKNPNLFEFTYTNGDISLEKTIKGE